MASDHYPILPSKLAETMQTRSPQLPRTIQKYGLSHHRAASLNNSISQNNWLPTLDEANAGKAFDTFCYAFKDQTDKQLLTEVTSNIGKKDKEGINEET